ncbi:RsmD family RNA methyltransferase [Candidatus Chlorohelix allophototropha]|uniref:RsmD family RNA methyltransferase n=1 Tax=Candidatus Chlorohelix allophototropha TaxID=3003348 RepID=A0ABY9B3B7_9CHLR|nr:RsmD family RNA methyltransferase [Chloroflexota bacterium L227-S17]
MRVIAGIAKGHTLKGPKSASTRPMADKVKGAVYSMLSNILSQLERDWGRVLDLYAGTGSIGIEALSRGAEWADFVEVNAGTCRIISDNLEHTGFAQLARVNNRSVTSFINAPPSNDSSQRKHRATGGLHRRKGGSWRDARLTLELEIDENQNPVEEQLAILPVEDTKYDIIFLDPPYADPKIPETIQHVARSGLLKSGGLVIIGHSPRVVLADSYEGDGIDADKPDTSSAMLKRIRFRQHGDSAFSIYMEGEPPPELLTAPDTD